MRFDVLVADNDTTYLSELKSHAKDRLKNIKITFFSNQEDILEFIEQTDLLILSIEIDNYPEIVKKCLDENIYVIFLIKDDLEINKTYDLKQYDTLTKPLDLDKLIYKIEHYINILNKDISLQKEQELSNSIINNVNYPIFLTDGHEVIFANDYFYNLIQCNSLEDINSKYSNIGDIYEYEDGYLTNENGQWLDECKKPNLKVCIIDGNNNKRFFSIQRISLTHNNTNIIMLNDISHEIKHKHELYKLLYTDNLTNLPNRAKLIEELQNQKALKLEAICILDINSFKEINDFFGHKVGDSILIELGKLIERHTHIWKSLKLYKFPSDTYCITNTSLSQTQFIEIVSNIIESAYKKVFIFDQYEIDIRITGGISFSNKNNKLITADIALQSAKKDHKDYLIFYDELDKFQEYENNMLWTKKLKSAFVNDNIEVYYQPLINNKTLKVDKYECLVRLIDEEGKVVAPFYFLDISKKSNQYIKLTKIVIEKSFKKFQNLPFEFSVNISYEDIESLGFLDYVKEMVEKYNVSNRVVFEILEDENIKNYDHLIHFIDEIKLLGCKVAIDDFGSGYSNFEHLLKMNVDYLKIDASLIKNIATDQNSYKITKTIIEFAKSLNLETIAEYVENEEIFNITKELGVDFSQGYYFAPPLKNPTVVEFKK
jgi:c-di-GMP phosphodiesterase